MYDVEQYKKSRSDFGYVIEIRLQNDSQVKGTFSTEVSYYVLLYPVHKDV